MQCGSMKIVLGLLVGFGFWFAGSADAHAYDYLEHAYFTDDACVRVQKLLAQSLKGKKATDDLMARYIALGMYCPVQWKKPYCKGGYKLMAGHINRLEKPPAKSKDYSVTLGDYAALPDHLSRFGPIRGLPRAGKNGLVERTWEWIGDDPDSAGGVIEDVAEDACETDNLAPWSTIDQDINAYLGRIEKTKQPLRVPEAYLSPMARAAVPKGPSDPAGLYSFDNPHYLDLVLRNHHHFGVQAYSSWLGFHSAAVQIAARTCEDTLALDDDVMEDLADDVPGFEDIDWEELSASSYRTRACGLLKFYMRRHLHHWAKSQPAAMIPPVKKALDRLFAPTMDPAQLVYQELFLDRIIGAVSALVFEGSGLHFLQDGLASGHMRTIRTRGGLQEVRYDHDEDNREGVVAIFRTRSGSYPFVAFGDTYLLGPALKGRRRCDWTTIAKDKPTKAEITTCLVQHQRGLMAAATMASLLDWALGGTLYGKPQLNPTPKVSLARKCPGSSLDQFICAHLPTQATMVAGEELPEGFGNQHVHHGALPVPPPAFSYESLTLRFGMDVAGDALQTKLNVAFLSELDDYANWLTSYRIGIGLTFGQQQREQIFADFGYHFHWRWAARFLIDAGLSTYAGLRNFQQEDISFFGGIAPVVGTTVLPEGWVKMPLEITLSYRVPLTLLTSNEGIPDRIFEGHWFYVGFGLAFLK